MKSTTLTSILILTMKYLRVLVDKSGCLPGVLLLCLLCLEECFYDVVSKRAPQIGAIQEGI